MVSPLGGNLREIHYSCTTQSPCVDPVETDRNLDSWEIMFSMAPSEVDLGLKKKKKKQKTLLENDEAKMSKTDDQ